MLVFRSAKQKLTIRETTMRCGLRLILPLCQILHFSALCPPDFAAIAKAIIARTGVSVEILRLEIVDREDLTKRTAPVQLWAGRLGTTS